MSGAVFAQKKVVVGESVFTSLAPGRAGVHYASYSSARRRANSCPPETEFGEEEWSSQETFCGRWRGVLASGRGNMVTDLSLELFEDTKVQKRQADHDHASTAASDASSDLGSEAESDENRMRSEKELYMAQHPSWNIMLGNLPCKVTEEHVMEAARNLGFANFTSVHIPRKRYERNNRGFAFIGFFDQGVAAEAFTAFDGFKFPGRTTEKRLIVSWAKTHGAWPGHITA